MPSWFTFRRKESPSPSPPSQARNQNAKLKSSIPNVSTYASVNEIINSVSAANAQVNIPTSTRITTGGGSAAAAAAAAAAAPLSPRKERLIVKKCICCGTRLQFPPNLPYFKCSICETFHDLETFPPSDGICLNFELVKATIEADERNHETFHPGFTEDARKFRLPKPNPNQYVHLEALLSSCFSSIAALNNSFPLAEHVMSSASSKLSYSRPNVDLAAVREFYQAIANLASESPMRCIVTALISLLKRPKQSLESPGDAVFMLVILENPLLYNFSIFSAKGETIKFGKLQPLLLELLERTVGILAHSPKKSRHYILNWLSRYPVDMFQPKVELLNAYVAHRLTLHYTSRKSYTATFEAIDKRRLSDFSGGTSSAAANGSNGATSSSAARRHSRSMSVPIDESSPSSSSRHHGSAGSSSSHRHRHNHSMHGIVGMPRARKRRSIGGKRIRPELYGDDWRIAAFLRVLAIFFNANTVINTPKIPISAFYNSMVDFTDVTSDFDDWQKLGVPSSTLSHHHIQPHPRDTSTMVPPAASNPVKSGTFGAFDFSIMHHPRVAFCQYPFLLSMSSKTQILEYDARRQMEHMAQEAFFGALEMRCSASPYLYIRVRREKLLEDSFKAFEQFEGDLKKGLRIEFIGEPGVDAGGLRKEWFLLLMRELFHPDTGAFVEEEESRYCWFDANSQLPLKYFKLTGVAVGLALYNSTILDVNFPPVVFKKLLGCGYTLEDFAEFKPSYGRNLKYLLEYEGDDFEQVFGLNFTVSAVNAQGVVYDKPLTLDGESTVVTKANRGDYVKRVISYYMDVSVRKEFDAFKQGFYNVCGGNALTLFRPEELELLIRGCLEPIDVEALKSVTKYQNFGVKDASQHVVVKWFWKYFAGLTPEKQRRLLQFVTGSDRVPATGIANLPFKISSAGPDTNRLPTCHTCFNQLCIYEYSSRAKLEAKMDMAVECSQGFGIK